MSVDGLWWQVGTGGVGGGGEIVVRHTGLADTELLSNRP